MADDELPRRVRIDAWTGAAAADGELDAAADRWGTRPGLPGSQAVLPWSVADPSDWSSPDVGYGLVLPDAPLDPDDGGPSVAERASGRDAPEPVRQLLEARPGAVLVRWRPELGDRKLRRHYLDGASQDVAVGLSWPGTGRARLPRYLLLVGTPTQLPWSLQYALNTSHFVGRLPFDPDDPPGVEALGNYVDALVSGWRGRSGDPTAPLVWAVDHGGGDITSDMRVVLADPLVRSLREDGDLVETQVVTAAAATGAALVAALRRRPPVLLVTSSHGRTHPLADPTVMQAHLGLPVDANHHDLKVDELTGAMPPGTIWFSQACCSAGSDAVVDADGVMSSRYAGLLAEGSGAHAVVQSVARIGPSTAPAALALLGRPDPVRAVIGHVEPTFDWTLRVDDTGQGLGRHLVDALGAKLHTGTPLGLALADYRAGVGELHTQWADVRDRYNRDGTVALRAVLTRLRLTAMDRQSLVLLGDPTVTMPTEGPA